MHRRASQIEIIAHTQDVGVAKFIIEKWIRKCPVAVVCCPGLGLCMATKTGDQS